MRQVCYQLCQTYPIISTSVTNGSRSQSVRAGEWGGSPEETFQGSGSGGLARITAKFLSVFVNLRHGHDISIMTWTRDNQSTEPQTKTQLTYWDHKYLMMNKELIQVRPSLTPHDWQEAIKQEQRGIKRFFSSSTFLPPSDQRQWKEYIDPDIRQLLNW